MIEGRCRDCRHWNGAKIKGAPGYGRCGYAESHGDFSHKRGYEPPSPDEQPMVIFMDDDPYVGGSLITTPDFGCTGFAAKEDGGGSR